MSRDRNDLDAKRREILEKIADAILTDKSSHKKLHDILDRVMEFQRLRAQGYDVKLRGNLILIPGKAGGKSDEGAQSAKSRGAIQLAARNRVKCVGILAAGLAGWFLLAGYCNLIDSLSAAQVPPSYISDVYYYCRLCEDDP